MRIRTPRVYRWSGASIYLARTAPLADRGCADRGACRRPDCWAQGYGVAGGPSPLGSVWEDSRNVVDTKMG